MTHYNQILDNNLVLKYNREEQQKVCDYNFFMLPDFKSIMLTLLSYQIGAGGREAELKKLREGEVDFSAQVNTWNNQLGGNYLRKE